MKERWYKREIVRERDGVKGKWCEREMVQKGNGVRGRREMM